MNTILAYWYLKLQALVLLVFGKQQAALEKFDQMLVLRPGDRYALASRAHVLAQEGDKHGAIAALRSLAERYPDNAAAWFNLAYMLDDLLILAVGVYTLSQHRLQEKEGRVLKLLSGVVMVGLGIYLLLP